MAMPDRLTPAEAGATAGSGSFVAPRVDNPLADRISATDALRPGTRNINGTPVPLGVPNEDAFDNTGVNVGYKEIAPDGTTILRTGRGQVLPRHHWWDNVPRPPKIGPLRPRDYLSAGFTATALAIALSRAAGGPAPSSNEPQPTDEPQPTSGGIVLKTSAPSLAPTQGLPSGSIVAIPSPSFEPTPTPAPPSPEPTGTPVATQVEQSASATPDTTPVPTNSPEALKDLAKNLDDWVNGRINIDKSRLFVRSPGHPEDLSIIENADYSNPDWAPRFQAIVLGSEIVDNHLIAYLGMKDGSGNNFYIPINLDTYRTAKKSIVVRAGDSSEYPTGNISYNPINSPEMQVLLGKLKNDAVLMQTNLKKLPILSSYTPDDVAWIEAYNKQCDTTLAFIKWTYQIKKQGQDYTQQIPSELAFMIDQRPKSIEDVDLIPLSIQFDYIYNQV